MAGDGSIPLRGAEDWVLDLDPNENIWSTNLSTPAPKSKTCSTTSMTEPTPSSGDNNRLT